MRSADVGWRSSNKACRLKTDDDKPPQIHFLPIKSGTDELSTAYLSEISLPPKRNNRVEAGCLPSGIEAEEESDGRRHAYGGEHRPGREKRGPAGVRGNDLGGGEADEDPAESTDEAQDDGLDQELQHHIRAACAHGEAKADLPRALRHTHHHHIHDADAADEE